MTDLLQRARAYVAKAEQWTDSDDAYEAAAIIRELIAGRGLQDFATDIASRQTRLDPEAERILHERRKDLYIGAPAPSAVEAQAVAWMLTRDDCAHPGIAWTEDMARYLETKGYKLTPLYASPPPSTRDEIIEECARVCDQVGKDWQKLGPTPIIETACQECAADVRSLKRGATKGVRE